MAIKKTKEFGMRLRQVLKSSPLQTVAALSKEIKVSQSAIYSWIKGDTSPGADHLLRLVEALPRLKEPEKPDPPVPAREFSKDDVRWRAKAFLKVFRKLLAEPKIAEALWDVLVTAHALGLTMDDLVEQVLP